MKSLHQTANLTRRDVLRLGGLSLAGLSLAPLGASPAAANAARAATAKHCILLFMNGGPSHLDTWDPKPDAHAEIRGEFGAIPTSVSGIRITEHLPHLARLAGRYAIVRSVTSSEGSHDGACRTMLTGQTPSERAWYPDYGTVIARELGPASGLPAYVAVGRPLRSLDGAGQASEYHAVAVASSSGEPGRPSLRRVSDVSAEPAKVAERYGASEFGVDCLAARRLVEAGARFVTVSMSGWDTHGNNFQSLRERLLPQFDRGMSALLEDLGDRGLLEETLVVWMGDFGRTPRVNSYAGRDHHPHCQSVVLAGGGIAGGQVIGASNATGAEPAEHPVTPGDLGAMIYQAMGVSAPGESRTAQA